MSQNWRHCCFSFFVVFPILFVALAVLAFECAEWGNAAGSKSQCLWRTYALEWLPPILMFPVSLFMCTFYEDVYQILFWFSWPVSLGIFWIHSTLFFPVVLYSESLHRANLTSLSLGNISETQVRHFAFNPPGIAAGLPRGPIMAVMTLMWSSLWNLWWKETSSASATSKAAVPILTIQRCATIQMRGGAGDGSTKKFTTIRMTLNTRSVRIMTCACSIPIYVLHQ
jgi:hypothetical protein